MVNLYTNSFIIYSNAPYSDIEKYLQSIWDKFNWEKKTQFEEISSVVVESSVTANSIVQFNFSGQLAFRLKEILLNELETENLMEDYFFGLADINEPFLVEYKNKKNTFITNNEDDPLDSIQSHLSKRIIFPFKPENPNLKFLLSHQNQSYKPTAFIKLIDWARQKIQDKGRSNYFIEGWGFLNYYDSRLTMQWNSDFTPDWLSMQRWLKNSGLSQRIDLENLQKEFHFIRQHFDQASIDLKLPDGSLVWSYKTVEMYRTDALTFAQTRVPSKKVICYEGNMRSHIRHL